jgi:ABC-type nitrate/sulfonate/bicarbonate transport system substrate-binding protein
MRTAALAPLAFGRMAHAADKPSEIRIDWATYNPVSMVLKEKGLLENEFAKDGIGIRWVQTLGSNKALEFLNAGSIDFGSTAGLRGAARQDQRQSDQIDLRLFPAGMDGSSDQKRYADHQNRGPQR